MAKKTGFWSISREEWKRGKKPKWIGLKQPEVIVGAFTLKMTPSGILLLINVQGKKRVSWHVWVQRRPGDLRVVLGGIGLMGNLVGHEPKRGKR